MTHAPRWTVSLLKKVIPPVIAGEMVVTGLLLAVAYPGAWWSWTVLAGGLGLLGVTLVPPGTYTHHQAVTRLRRLTRRRARTAGNGHADGLSALAGPVKVRPVDHGGQAVGVAEDTGGWFALAEFAPSRDLRDLRPDTEPLPAPELLARVLQDGRDPSAIQLICHTIPTPSALLPPEWPVTASYRDLVGASPAATARFVWVCARIDAVDGAAIVARHGGDPTAAARATAAAILRASRTLRLGGTTIRVLNAQELTSALVLSGLTVPRPEMITEGWTAIAANNGLAQVSYSAADSPPGFTAALAAVPAAATTLAITISGRPQTGGVRRLVRLIAPVPHLRVSDHVLRSVAQHTGVTLTRLDGRHGPAAYAAGPTCASLPPSGGYATAGAAAGLDALGVAWQPLPEGGTGSAREPGAPVGLMIGRDVDRRPTIIRLFRSGPTEVTLVGGLATARVLVLRALAVGARVYVRTGHAAEWAGLGHATGHPDRIVVGVDPLPPADPHQPVLVVDELDPAAPTRVGLRPWQTRLTVLRQLTPAGAQRLADAHLAILRRITDDEAEIAGKALGMTGDTRRSLTRLPDAMIALVGGGVNSYTWLEPTPWEASVAVTGAAW